MEIKQISESAIRRLIENIEEGNVNLYLVKDKKVKRVISETVRDERISEAMDLYDRAMPILVDTIVGPVGAIASEYEKDQVIRGKIKKIKKMKTINFSTDYEKDSYEDLKDDFSEAIKELTDIDDSFVANIYDESIDEIINPSNKCKVKK